MSGTKQRVLGLFLAMRSRVSRVVGGMVAGGDVEDILQDTYLRLHEMKRADHIRNPEAFIFQTARNLALDHLKRADSRLVDRHENVEQLQELAAQRDADTIYREVAVGKDFSDFCAAVQQLPEQCRRAFVLRKVYGYSQREIAETLEISVSSVEKHVARGLRLIYRTLHEAPASTEMGEVVTDMALHRARRRVEP